jgi:hypothetical protein
VFRSAVAVAVQLSAADLPEAAHSKRYQQRHNHSSLSALWKYEAYHH